MNSINEEFPHKHKNFTAVNSELSTPYDSLNMDLLDVRTTFVPIQPFIDLNPDPVDIYDKLTTPGHVYNSLLRTGRLNATVTRSDKIGECRWIDNQSNCTGIFKKMSENSVDFCLYPMAYEEYEDKNLFSPLIVSAHMTAELDRVFLSTAQVPEKIADVSPSNVFMQFPLSIYALNLLVLCLVILMIHFRLRTSSGLRIDILDAIALHTLRWSKTYNSCCRRIIVYATLLYAIFSHNFYSG